jgi:hypothetical protein
MAHGIFDADHRLLRKRYAGGRRARRLVLDDQTGGGPCSINEPKLVELSVTATIVDVPVLVILPLARGVAALGRTRTFCHVSEQVTRCCCRR